MIESASPVLPVTKAFPSISFQGDEFSPAEAERVTGLRFAEKQEPGDLGLSGRFKGKPTPYGFATLQPPDETWNEDKKLTWLLDAALPHVETLKRLGADWNRVHIDYAYTAQCNLAFEPELIAKLARLGLPFTISCYREESAFE